MRKGHKMQAIGKYIGMGDMVRFPDTNIPGLTITAKYVFEVLAIYMDTLLYMSLLRTDAQLLNTL
jgi:hypothetical protein